MIAVIKGALTAPVITADDAMFVGKAVTFIPYAYNFSTDGFDLMLDLIRSGTHPAAIAAMASLSGNNLLITASNHVAGVNILVSSERVDPSSETFPRGTYVNKDAYNTSAVVDALDTLLSTQPLAGAMLYSGIHAMYSIDRTKARAAAVSRIEASSVDRVALHMIIHGILLDDRFVAEREHFVDLMCERVISGAMPAATPSMLSFLARSSDAKEFDVEGILAALASEDRRLYDFGADVAARFQSALESNRPVAASNLVRVLNSSSEAARTGAMRLVRKFSPELLSALQSTGFDAR